MKKNIILLFFSIIFSLSLIYLTVFTWVYVSQKYIDPNNFSNIDNLNFHEKYSNQTHHLRGNNWPYHKKNLLINKEDYLFSTVSNFEKNHDNYLIQGDSWVEYMVFKDKLNETLKKIAKGKKIGLINAGISSFSPSPMKIQYRILEQEYEIKPDFLISIIDQTDIGDELCRYKNNIVENADGTVKQIRRETDTGAVMDFSKYYFFSRLLLEKKSFINYHVTNYYIARGFKIIKIRFINLIKNGLKNSGSYNCKFQNIQKYLFSLKNEEEEYFKKRTQEYLDYLTSKAYLKKIFVVTFPHKNHLDGNYEINVSNIINELNLSKKVIHIDFTEIIGNKEFASNNIYHPDDPASHLNEETHILFVKKIFELIDLEIKN